jgi:hypothetical protein
MAQARSIVHHRSCQTSAFPLTLLNLELMFFRLTNRYFVMCMHVGTEIQSIMLFRQSLHLHLRRPAGMNSISIDLKEDAFLDFFSFRSLNIFRGRIQFNLNGDSTYVENSGYRSSFKMMYDIFRKH